MIIRNGRLFHDGEVDRTTDGSGSIHDFTLSELKNLDAGSWFSADFSGERVPTLDELFEYCRDRVHYLLEIKDPGLIEEQLANAIVASGLGGQIYVIGKSPEALEKVKETCPEIGVGFTCQIPNDEGIDRALSMGANHVIIRNELLTSELITTSANRGLHVLSTTVRTEEQLERAVRCRVLGMPLPDPRRLHEYLR